MTETNPATRYRTNLQGEVDSAGLYRALADAERFALNGTNALIASGVASGLALLLIGAGTSLFTGRNLYFTALRRVLIGLAAAGITFGVGRLVGVSLAG